MPRRGVRALELRVDPTEKVHALRSNIDFAFVPCAVEAAELRVHDELLRGLCGQVAITAREVDAADAKFSDLTMEQWSERADLEDDVGDVGERRAEGDRLSPPQILPACVGARLRRAVRVDDLAPTPRPRLYERVGKGFTCRHDVAAQGIWKIHLWS